MGVLQRLGLRGKRRKAHRGEAHSLVATAYGKGGTADEEENPDREVGPALQRPATPLHRALDGAAAAATGTLILPIVRSPLWLPEGGAEETWQLTVPRHAKMADVKSAISRIYKIPESAMRLQAKQTPGEPCLPDDACVDSAALLKKTIHLLPTEEFMREAVAAAALEEQCEAEACEAAEAAEALQRRLADAVYKLRFVAAEDAGERVAGQDITLDIPALAPVGEVQARVECAIFGGEAERPRGLCFVFRDEVLPPQIPVSYAGVVDGDTLIIYDSAACFNEAGADDESETDSLDDGILTWAFQ